MTYDLYSVDRGMEWVAWVFDYVVVWYLQGGRSGGGANAGAGATGGPVSADILNRITKLEDHNASLLKSRLN